MQNYVKASIILSRDCYVNRRNKSCDKFSEKNSAKQGGVSSSCIAEPKSLRETIDEIGPSRKCKVDVKQRLSFPTSAKRNGAIRHTRASYWGGGVQKICKGGANDLAIVFLKTRKVN